MPRFTRAAGLTVGLLAATAGLAATNQTALTAAPIVVTASRTRQPADQIPAQVRVITAGDVAASGAQNIVEALETLGGVYVRELTGNPAQAEVSLRGFGENSHGRVLVLRDGQRLNSPDMAGVNWLQIPLSMIERIEIVSGAQNVLYGDHALAGVINVVTRDGADVATRELAAGAGSYDTYQASASAAGSLERTRYAANVDWRASQGYRENGDYDATDLRAAVSQDWDERRHTSLALAFDDYSYGLPGYLTRDQMEDDPRQTLTPDDHADTRNGNLNLGLDLVTREPDRLAVNLLVNRREVESTLVSWSSFVDTTVDSLTLTPNYTTAFTALGRPHRLLVGIDFYGDSLEADRLADIERTQPLLDASIDKLAAGLYLQDDISLTPRLTLGLGSRVERARYDATVDDVALGRTVDDQVDHDAYALASSLLYRPNASTKLFTRAATVYRYPFVDEQVSYYGYGTDTFYQDLDPETGLNLETGGSLRLGRSWSAELTLFHLAMEDEIAYNPATGANTNLDETRRLGAEAGARWSQVEIGQLGCFYTFTDAEFTAGPHDGSDVPLVPRHHVAVNGQLPLPFHLTALADLNAVGTQVVGGDYDNTGDKLDGYLTVDVALRYTHPGANALTLLAGVDNVFDEEYANVAYQGFSDTGYYPAAGQTWKAAVSGRF